MTARVSIALATYNGERYLSEQLESLAKQTRMPFELIVTDDASTDGTWNILEQFASKAPFPVHLYANNINLGYVDNFLKAASLCKGDWIAFCDQDDIWLPNKIQRTAEVINNKENTDVVLIGHTSHVSDCHLNVGKQFVPHFKVTKKYLPHEHYAFFCVVGFSAIIKRDLISEIDHSLRPKQSEDGSRLGHDQWFGMLANVLGSIYCINEPLAIWRRHESSTTGTPKDEGLISQAIFSGNAVDATAYKTKSTMAIQAAGCLVKIAKTSTAPSLNFKLIDGAIKMQRLAKHFHARSQLYSSSNHIQRLKKLAVLLYQNAYFDIPMCSLGWKSFLKDIAYTFGVLGLIKHIRRIN